MIKTQVLSKPDIIGASISGLCAVHCILTPFIFLAQAGTSLGHIETPLWYRTFDYVFIGVSFFAVYYAARNSAKGWVSKALWITWVVLLLGILNEAFEIMHLPEASVYIPALALAGLHLYNRRYCQCEDENCCTENVKL